MTREQAKTEIMQIYGSLSEEKKQALDVLMAQADGEYISRKYIHSVLHNHMFDNAHKPTIYAELKRISKELDGLSVAIPSAEPSGDLISRQAVKEQMIKYGFHAPDMTVTEFVEDLPSVKPQEKTGHWIAGDGCREVYAMEYECSECGCNVIGGGDFCKWCGARMD